MNKFPPILETQQLWLSEKEVSAMTGISRSTLQKHRFKGIGIPYSKIGSLVRYALGDVVAFMDQRRVNPPTNYQEAGRSLISLPQMAKNCGSCHSKFNH